MAKFEYQNCNTDYIEDALELALCEYREECAENEHLPQENFREELREMLTELFQQPFGKMAFKDGHMIGYLAFWGPFEGHFGNVNGVFSPFGGNAFTGNDRGKLASLLFEEVSREMILQHVGSYAICRPAGCDIVNRTLVMSGFGIRCSDAILRLSAKAWQCDLDPTFSFCELDHSEIACMRPLREKLCLHLCDAPIFFPPLIPEMDQWFANESIRVFAAIKNDCAVGFIAITDDGETYLTENSEMMNICGAYVEPDYRRFGIAKQLLSYICDICSKEGYTYLGVDCETMNPTALRFWGKYFQSYTYSYVRRIDERCFDYLGYLQDEVWKHGEF